MNDVIKKNDGVEGTALGSSVAGEEKKVDVLAQIKRAEQAIKQATLVKMISDIKNMAHDILELKEKCVMLLSEIGLTDEDIKRVIDFVNNLPTVQLSKVDKEAIGNWARDQVQGKRKDIEKKIEEKIKISDLTLYSRPENMFLVTNENSGKYGTTHGGMKFGVNTGDAPQQFGYTSDVVLCSTSGEELKIKI